MNKSLFLRAFLLCLTALIGAGMVSARPFSPILPARPAAVVVLTAVSDSLGDPTLSTGAGSLVRNPWVGPIVQDGEYKRDDRHLVGDKGENKGDHAPSPAPEPSTILSLCVAMAIGGGVYFLGRLRRERK
jgi:hypothetical protein